MNITTTASDGRIARVDLGAKQIRSTAKRLSYQEAQRRRMFPLAISPDACVVLVEDVLPNVTQAACEMLESIGAAQKATLLNTDERTFNDALDYVYAIVGTTASGEEVAVDRASGEFLSAAHMIDRETAFLHMVVPVRVNSDHSVLVGVLNKSIPNEARDLIGDGTLHPVIFARDDLTTLINAAFTSVHDIPTSSVLEVFQRIAADALRQKVKSLAFDTVGERTIVSGRIGRRMRPFRSEATRSLPAAFVRQLTNTLMAFSGALADDDQSFDYDFRVELPIGGKPVVMRGASLPASGETLVIRLAGLNTHYPLERIGFLAEQLERIYYIIERAEGMVLVGGPSGHGKSTLLRELFANYHQIFPFLRFYTAENPAETAVPFARQVSIERARRLTFERLREMFARMECDALMLAELRDKATYGLAFVFAEIADKIFATTHAPNAELTIYEMLTRTSRLSVAMYIDTVIAMRLLSTLCEPCSEKVPFDPTGPNKRYHGPFAELLKKWMPKTEVAYVKRPRADAGCSLCDDGYRREDRPVFEIFEMNEEARGKLINGATPSEVIACDPHFKPMVYHAMHLVLAGTVSVETMLRSTRTNAFIYRSNDVGQSAQEAAG